MKRLGRVSTGRMAIAVGGAVALAVVAFGVARVDSLGRGVTPERQLSVSSSATPIPADARCRARSLSLGYDQSGAAGAGSFPGWYVVTNNGSATCYLSGVPQITVTRTTPAGYPYVFTELPAGNHGTVAILSPGGTASFLVDMFSCQLGPGQTPASVKSPPHPLSYGNVRIVLPGSSHAYSFSIGLGLVDCGRQAWSVSPLANGFTPYGSSATGNAKEVHPVNGVSLVPNQ